MIKNGLWSVAETDTEVSVVVNPDVLVCKVKPINDTCKDCPGMKDKKIEECREIHRQKPAIGNSKIAICARQLEFMDCVVLAAARKMSKDSNYEHIKKLLSSDQAEFAYTLQCPNCGSTNVKRTDTEMVKCQSCSSKTDYFEAYQHYQNHPESRKA